MNRFQVPGIDLGSHYQSSKHCFQPTSALERAREPSDPAEMIKVLCHGPFFGVGGSGRRPSRMYHFGDQDWGSGPKTPPALAIGNLAVYRPPLAGGVYTCFSRANRLASNLKTPPALALSHLAVYRAP